MEWTEDLENLLKTWAKRIKSNSIMHRELAKKYRQFNISLGVPSSALGALSVSSGLLTLNSCGLDERFCIYIRGAIYSIMFVSTSLGAIQTFFNFGAKSKEHSMASDRLSALNRIIENVLALSRDQRGSAVEMVSSIRNQYELIINNSPSLKSIYTELEEVKVLNDISGESINFDGFSSIGRATSVKMSELMDKAIVDNKSTNDELAFQLKRLTFK